MRFIKKGFFSRMLFLREQICRVMYEAELLFFYLPLDFPFPLPFPFPEYSGGGVDDPASFLEGDCVRETEGGGMADVEAAVGAGFWEV